MMHSSDCRRCTATISFATDALRHLAKHLQSVVPRSQPAVSVSEEELSACREDIYRGPVTCTDMEYEWSILQFVSSSTRPHWVHLRHILNSLSVCVSWPQCWQWEIILRQHWNAECFQSQTWSIYGDCCDSELADWLVFAEMTWSTVFVRLLWNDQIDAIYLCVLLSE